MNEFVGNNIKFLAQWGQLTLLFFMMMLVSLFTLLVWRNKYFLPKGFLSWSSGIALFILMLLSVLIFARITVVKPGVMAIIDQLESLKGEKAPPLTFQLVADGSMHALEEYRGKVVLVNFWATWCAPCLKELPDLNRLHSSYADSGLVVLAVSDEEMEKIQRYAHKSPFNLAAARVASFDWVSLGSERPASFLIDKEGVVQEYYTGPYDYAFFEKEIKSYLNK